LEPLFHRHRRGAGFNAHPGNPAQPFGRTVLAGGDGISLHCGNPSDFLAVHISRQQSNSKLDRPARGLGNATPSMGVFACSKRNSEFRGASLFASVHSENGLKAKMQRASFA
jgi:hypothetical protein